MAKIYNNNDNFLANGPTKNIVFFSYSKSNDNSTSSFRS